MKERIVIEGKEPQIVIRQFVKCSGLQTYEDLEKKHKLAICGEELRVEQVPETWEELKELCKETRYISQICKEKNIPVYLNEFGTGYIIIKDLYFGVNGIVFYEVLGQRYIIAEGLTPARQWQIIKSLIGEE